MGNCFSKANLILDRDQVPTNKSLKNPVLIQKVWVSETDAMSPNVSANFEKLVLRLSASVIRPSTFL
jgi:hypothetical protein